VVSRIARVLSSGYFTTTPVAASSLHTVRRFSSPPRQELTHMLTVPYVTVCWHVVNKLLLLNRPIVFYCLVL